MYSAVIRPRAPRATIEAARSFMTPDDLTSAAGPRTLRSTEDLVDAGLVAPEQAAAIEAVAERYAVAIPPALAALIDPADADDPIARQFVPDPAELKTASEERADPIGDDTHSPVAGVVHRYPDRVLLKLVHVCPVYCRFCFRRAKVGPTVRPTLTADELAAAYAYVRARPEIWEVVLTGGDPLILSPRRLHAVMEALGAIDHVKVVRVHTRVPVAVPDAITPDLIAALQAARKALYVVLHANHPRELTATARAACARLVDAGLPMLSQSVLLKGVNDDAAVLSALMRAFVEARVKPYYLHQGDLAPGTSHLRTSIDEGQSLMRALRGRLSGVAQPTYVLDIPGGAGKVPVGPGYLAARTDPAGAPAWNVEDVNGCRHRYPPDGE
jgi:lysine 2,3-aminomutase